MNFIADIRKAVLYNEMIFHLEGYFLDNRSIALSNKASLYLNHHEMIQDLREQFEQDYYRIFQYIESIFKNYFIQKLEGDWEFDFKKDRTYHQIYKSHWKRKELNIHFELNLSHNSLINHSLSIMLDIEGTKWEAFKNGYDKKLKEQLNDLFSNHQILYRKGKRGQTFAYKNYHFLTPHHLEDEEIIHQHLIEMIEEFIGMVGPVDQAIERFYHNSC